MKMMRGEQFLIIWTGLVLLAGCGGGDAPVQEVVRPVKLHTIEGYGAGGGRQYPGKIEANQDVALAFELSGKLIELPINKGEDVSKGDLIARIDPERYKNSYLKAQADYNQAEKDYQRNKTLYENGAIAASELDTYLRSRDVAMASLKTAQRDLNDTVLRAPFAGVIALQPASNFENVSSGQEIARLQDVSLLLIKVNIPEAVISANNEALLSIEQVNERLNANMRLTTNEDRRYNVYLKDVETEADPATRTYEATFALNPPEDASILPGMTAVVEVEPTKIRQEELSAIRPIFMVPATSIAADPEGKQYVWLVNPESMEVSQAYVTTGEIFEEEIQVLDGLEPGCTVVAAGVTYLREGMKVKRMQDPSEG
ncbi:MAG: efflux RND transporter periplasmic adaptor subunit [Verrucomicrobiota bacterium]